MDFKWIDSCIGLGSGAVMALVTGLLVSPGWNLMLGMITGGVIGMTLMVILMLVLMPFFGAFETMIPLGVNGMLVGMLSGMAATHAAVPPGCLVAAGALLGLGVAIIIHFSNKSYQRPGRAA